MKTRPPFAPDVWIAEHGGALATVLAPRHDTARQVAAKCLHGTTEALSFRIAFETGTFFVKGFDMSQPGARNKLLREYQVAHKLHVLDLVPKPVAINEERGFVACMFHDLPPLSDVLTDENLARHCQSLGQWLRQISDQMGLQRASGDWGSYLGRYPELTEDAMVSDTVLTGPGLPIRWVSVAKNDGALSNFLLREDGGLCGVDFADAVLKPVGWDLLMVARPLVRRFPDRAQDIAQALVTGWGDDIGGIAADRFRPFLMNFALATGFRSYSGEHKALKSYLDRWLTRYPHSAPRPTGAAMLPACGTDMQPSARLDRRTLEAHLRASAQEALSNPTTPDPVSKAEPAGNILGNLCRLCAGRCCNQGYRNHAFLAAGTLQKTAQARAIASVDELVSHYLKRLPPVHVRDSCLFHGPGGCALPREDRSEICNSYVCKPALQLEDRLERETDVVIVVASHENRPYRAAVAEGAQFSDVNLADLT